VITLLEIESLTERNIPGPFREVKNKGWRWGKHLLYSTVVVVGPSLWRGSMVHSRTGFQECLKRVLVTFKLTIYVTHSPELFALCDDVLVSKSGKMHRQGLLPRFLLNLMHHE